MAVIISRRSSYCPNFATAPSVLSAQADKTRMEIKARAAMVMVRFMGVPFRRLCMGESMKD